MFKIEPILESLELCDISDKEYFGKEYADYISNSRLSHINPEQGGSPEKFFGKWNTLMSDSLVFGSAVHCMTLQPNDFLIVDTVDRPTAKMGFMADELYKPTGKVPTDEEIIAASDKVDYYKGKMTDTKISNVKNKCNNYWRSRAIYESKYDGEKELIYLDEKSREKLSLCMDSINKNTKIQDLLHPKGIIEDPISMNEATILMDIKCTLDDQEVILKLKAKLDNFTISKELNLVTLNDLKTTGHFTTDFENSWERFHYYRQMGMYGWLLTLVANKYYDLENPTLKGNMLLISTVPKYYSDVFVVNKKEFLKGFKEFKRLIKLVTYYTLNGYGQTFRLY